MVVSNFLLFSPLFGEDSHFDEHIFQMGWFNHQPVNDWLELTNPTKSKVPDLSPRFVSETDGQMVPSRILTLVSRVWRLDSGPHVQPHWKWGDLGFLWESFQDLQHDFSFWCFLIMHLLRNDDLIWRMDSARNRGLYEDFPNFLPFKVDNRWFWHLIHSTELFPPTFFFRTPLFTLLN